MTRRSRHGLEASVIGLFVSTLMLGGGGATSAHDSDCLAQLREVPLEELALPSGHQWSWLDWDDVTGSWNASIPGVGHEGEYPGSIDVRLWCSSDAAANMVRQDELSEFMGTDTGLGVAVIGDESVARRSPPDPLWDAVTVTLEWRNGNVMASLEDNSTLQDFAMLEKLAQDIDALLP